MTNERYTDQLREALNRLVDALALPGRDVARAWDEALLVSGRYCEPYLDGDPLSAIADYLQRHAIDTTGGELVGHLAAQIRSGAWRDKSARLSSSTTLPADASGE